MPGESMLMSRGTLWAIVVVFAVALVTLAPALLPPGAALFLLVVLPALSVGAYLLYRARGAGRTNPLSRVPPLPGRRLPKAMDAARVLDLIEARANGNYAEAVSYLRPPEQGPEDLLRAYHEARARPGADTWQRLRREVLRHMSEGGNGSSSRSDT